MYSLDSEWVDGCCWILYGRVSSILRNDCWTVVCSNIQYKGSIKFWNMKTTFKHDYLCFMLLLAWEPGFDWISPLKVNPINLRILELSKEHSRGSPEFRNYNLRQIGQGVLELWSNLQTDKHKLLFYIFRKSSY